MAITCCVDVKDLFLLSNYWDLSLSLSLSSNKDVSCVSPTFLVVERMRLLILVVSIMGHERVVVVIYMGREMGMERDMNGDASGN